MLSYLGPREMDTPPVRLVEDRAPFTLARNNPPLLSRQLERIREGDTLYLYGRKGYTEQVEVADTDGEGTILAIPAGYGEEHAFQADLYVRANFEGQRIRVEPRA